MNTPQRVVITKDETTGQLVIPPDSVYVGRGVYRKGQDPILDKHVLRNPHGGLHPCRVKACKKAVHGAEGANREYRRYVASRPHLIREAVNIADSGQNFACRCPMHVPCHIDVLLDVVAIWRWMHRDGQQPSRTSVMRAIDPDLHAELTTKKRAKRDRQRKEALQAAS